MNHPGNLVVLIARVVAGDYAPISYILSVPVFVAALALTTLFAALLGRAGMASLRCCFPDVSFSASPAARRLIQPTEKP